jgi:hypothetical protein
MEMLVMLLVHLKHYIIVRTVVSTSFPYSRPKQFEVQKADMCAKCTALSVLPRCENFVFNLRCLLS